MFARWNLHRSPLAPGVPLDGTDTVEGLRQLERLRAASLLNSSNRNAGGQAAPPAQHRRRRYQRYKGPFLEQLSVDDLKNDPRPWSQFSGIPSITAPAGGGGGGGGGIIRSSLQGYTFPASLDLLCERIEENAAFYCTNYLRCLLFILVLTLYLRPIAVLGALVLAVTISFNINTAIEQQRRRLGVGAQGEAAAAANAAAPTTLQSPLGAVLAISTWIAVVYTRCMPIILLGVSIGLVICLLHASLRTSPSELRLRGSSANATANPITLHFQRFNRAAAAPHSYTLGQVLGRQPCPPGCDPRLLFKQVHRTFIELTKAALGLGRRWLVYYLLSAWDTNELLREKQLTED
ncbi:hypothetical protein NADE_004252 [Nannochloris sp. 'desiccata']|nr:hypothetical protein KSW81_007234 [Chlorella desiccata (nom. nud.)]KAH7621647.1 hypothetical protein NADE_004252 [Chlorella desiccata (nom. nud.)]